MSDGAAASIRGYEEITASALAPFGFAEPERAARILRSLSGEGVTDALFERLLPHLLAALHACADPDRAVNNFERWAARLGARASQFDYLAAHPPAVHALVAVFAGSQFFANVLIAHPEYAEVVTNPEIRSLPRTFADYYRDVSRAVDIFKGPGGKRSALRRFKALEMLRIGARDLVGVADTAVVAGEISAFADAVVQKAYEFCAGEEREKRGLSDTPPFAVIGMGKLGARELNYSSDIDLIFVHGDDRPDVPTDFYLRLAENIVAALSQSTAEGFVFRVDMRLRPEGRFGALSRSLSSCRAYYESWGETWERQALLKARPIAGDPALGAAFVRMAQPFVFGRSAAGENVVEALRENKRRIETRMQVAGTWKTSVKEGFGGIRDIEFAIQMRQILLGRTNPALRAATSTRAALRRLAEMGVIPETDRTFLEDAYWFLRAVEHRLQILDELPVRVLPADARERRRLARRMGFADVSDFDTRYREITERVRALSTRLMGTSGAPEDGATDWMGLLANADDAAVRAHLLDLLRARRFVQAERALGLLRIPAVGTEHGGATPGTRSRFAAIVSPLVTHCARTADPDAALFGVETLAQASPSREALYAAFTDGGETLLARLCLLGAGSPPLVQTLAAHLELLDMLFDDDEMQTPTPRAELCERVRARLDAAKTDAGEARALAAFWRRERLRVGARDLWGETPDVATTGEELTDLAEAMLEGLLRVAARRAGAEATLPRLAVIGLGKFGGRELNFPSDGDLLYTHDRDEDGAAAIAIADALRVLMHELRTRHAVDMEFDPRLRPGGRFGLLSHTPEGYADYYGREADTWEKQALLKARPVAGNAEVAARYMTGVRETLSAAPLAAAEIEAIRAMKRRIENERVRPADLRTDLKLGLGAMSDIEWTAQLLQWRHIRTHPGVRVPGTRAALEALAAAHLLSRDDFLTLTECYDLLQRLRNAGYLRTGLPADTLPVKDPERLAVLARLLHFPDAAHVLAEHHERTSAVRSRFRHLFLGEKP